jgi:hypothetical protein
MRTVLYSIENPTVLQYVSGKGKEKKRKMAREPLLTFVVVL